MWRTLLPAGPVYSASIRKASYHCQGAHAEVSIVQISPCYKWLKQSLLIVSRAYWHWNPVRH